MSTKFGPAIKPRKTPLVCRATLFNFPATYVLGVPTGLTVFAKWNQDSPDIHFAESWTLPRDEALPGWGGVSSATGMRFEIEVEQLPEANHYSITLRVFNDDELLGSYEWPDVEIPPGPPFDSGILRIPESDRPPDIEVHVLD